MTTIRSPDSLMTARWYSSWILFADLLPIAVMYSVWIALTLSGRLARNSSPLLGDGSSSRFYSCCFEFFSFVSSSNNNSIYDDNSSPNESNKWTIADVFSRKPPSLSSSGNGSLYIRDCSSPGSRSQLDDRDELDVVDDELRRLLSES